MSYLPTIMEFIQKHCEEDPEIADLLNDIDRIQRDNNEMERQLQELDRENVRLEMELYKVELLTSQLNNIDIEKCNETNMRIFELSVDTRNLIAKIDFEKILKCHYMEMEQKCRKESESLQECMVRTAKWHEKMEQRYVVQKYRQAEVALKEAEASYQKQQESMKNSLNESTELINNATQRRNEIIVNLIKGSNNLKKQREEMEKLNVYEKYLEGLKKEKMDLIKQLEESQHKAFNFNPIVPYKPQDLSNESSGNLKNFNFAMPKLPSFTDILTAFKTKCETKTEIMVIENTTCIKSILHNSQNNSMEFNHSITTKLTKQVRFKVPLEEFQEDLKKDMESEETSSESSQQTTEAINELNEDDEEEEEIIEETEEIKNGSQIETIDLLTPTGTQDKQPIEAIEIMEESPEYEPVTTVEAEKKNLPSNKPKIEIQECIIFKAPLPVCQTTKLEEKENSLPTINPYKISSPDESISSKATSSKSSSNLFYDEFSPSSTKSQTKMKSHSKRSVLKDFHKYLNEAEDFSIDSKQNISSSAANQKDANKVDEEMFDFGSNSKMEFLFDSSDDNMGENNEHTKSNVFDFMN